MPSHASDPSPPLTGVSRLQRDAGASAAVLSGICVLASALILLESFAPWMVSRPTGGQVMARLVQLAAPAIYMAGLWRLGRALRLFAEAGRFVVAGADAVAGVGGALVVGGAFQILAAPGLERLAGYGPRYWIGLDPAAIALAALGVALLVFARQFKRAARLEAELDTIL